jgi:hypothetical protein
MATKTEAKAASFNGIVAKDTKNFKVVVSAEGSPYIAKIYIPLEVIRHIGSAEKYTVTITPA